MPPVKPIALVVPVEITRDTLNNIPLPPRAPAKPARVIFLDLEKYWEAVKAGPPKP